MALVQRSPTASTQPRTGQTPSQATISKLSKAMSDPSRTKYGETLGGRAGGCIAPDGGACGDYPKGWRFLPDATPEQKQILIKNPAVAEALRKIGNPKLGELPKCGARGQVSCTQRIIDYNARQQKIVNNAHYALVIAPQIKAQEEAIAREEEAERLFLETATHSIVTLKMRVQELEKQLPEPTPAPAVTSSLPIIPIIIIVVIVGFFLLRRRA